MSDETRTSLDRESQATAGLGAAGSGTLLLVIAEGLPLNHPLKPILVWAAPTFSVFSGVLFLWAQLRLREYLTERRADEVFKTAKQTITEALANPATSEQHRVKLRVELEKLELLMIRRQFARIKAISVVDEERGTGSPVEQPQVAR